MKPDREAQAAAKAAGLSPRDYAKQQADKPAKKSGKSK